MVKKNVFQIGENQYLEIEDPSATEMEHLMAKVEKLEEENKSLKRTISVVTELSLEIKNMAGLIAFNLEEG